MLVCDKCSAGIQSGAKFCPQCGDPVTDADKAALPAENNSVAKVEISFGHSTSPSYERAVEICKNLPTYTVTGAGKDLTHRISLPISEVELLINLLDLVGGWKSSQMLINGHAASKKHLTYHGVGCYRSRQKAYKPEQYCFGEREFEANIWGCKRLNLPVNEWGGGWLDYGDFDKSGVWHFDKRRIQHELEIAIRENELCPVLDKAKVFQTLESLPDCIDPKSDKNWAYRTTYEEVGGNYKEVAVGVKPVLKKVTRYVVGSYTPAWDLGAARTTGDGASSKIDFFEIENKRSEEEKKTLQEKPSIGAGVVWLAIAIIGILYLLLR